MFSRVIDSSWLDGSHRQECALKNGLFFSNANTTNVQCPQCFGYLIQWPDKGAHFTCHGSGCLFKGDSIVNTGSNRFNCFLCDYDLCFACVKRSGAVAANTNPFGEAQDLYGGGPDGKFGGSEAKFGGPQSRFGGSQSQLEGSQSRFGGSQSRLGASEVRFLGSNSKLGGSQSNFGGSQSKLGGSQSTLVHLEPEVKTEISSAGGWAVAPRSPGHQSRLPYDFQSHSYK